MKKHLIAIAVSMAAASLFGCNTATETTQSVEAQAPQQTEAQKLKQITDEYFNETMERNPIYATFVGMSEFNDRFSEPLSAESLQSQIDFEKKYQAKIAEVDASQLDGQDWITYEIFKYDRAHNLDGMQYGGEFVPLSQMGGAHTYFAMLGSGQSAQPFNTVEDYDKFMKRAKGFAEYMDSTITYMKKGIENGVVLPTPIAEKVLPQLAAHAVEDVTASVFYGPVAMLAENTEISEDDKARLTADMTSTIETVIIPAYQRVHDFMQEEYLSKTRDTVGLSALPNGKAWYEYQIQEHTTLPLSADDIHEFGQREVARILDEMNKVREEVEFEGDLSAFFEHLRTDDQFYFETSEEVIEAYTKIKEKIDARVPQLFEVFPKADYIVKAVEPYRAASAAGASYQSPAPDGSRPGIFYINTHNLKAQPKFLMETLSVHEAAPGHHFQIAIQQEVTGLPEFRKFGGYTVFAEGWALYAESLGKEMGLFTDPYMWYGRLADEQLRAMRLVVDTGLHAKGWTREQAIQFMLDNSSMAESDVVAEVERYISMPGQAVSYKVGERHIRQLREQAAAKLGDKFDIRKFHTEVLTDGSLPMPILSEKVARWMQQQGA